MNATLVAVLAMLLTPLAAFSAGRVEKPVVGASQEQTPTFPNDVSAAGLRALASQSQDPSLYNSLLPEDVLNRVRDYVQETKSLGLFSRSGIVRTNGLTPNVNANTNHVGDAIGETNAEVAVAVYKDTVVIGWNDSRGFVVGNTISSFGYSTDGGVTFVDGGNVPLALPTDQAFGDPGVDTDEKGNWYYNQIYTRAAGAPDPAAEQNIGVHNGHFVAGVLVWNPPTQSSIGTAATGNLDKCLLAVDRSVTGNVYVSYTRFTAVPRIEVVRSTDHGATWGAAIVVDASSTPTASKQAARPFCGPNGEVYVVWEKGANTINCPDGSGNVLNTQGQIGFTRSLNFGTSYDPFTVIGSPYLSFMASGPGDLRERANEFPDIAVDRSGGPTNGNIYVVWNAASNWLSSLSAGPVVAEAANAANNNPGGAEPFNIGDDVTGSISADADLDYWQFNAVQGQSYLFNLDPQGFVCGVTGTTRGMRLRLFATQTPYPNPTGFPDSLLSASAQGTFAQRIVWTAPKTGSYLLRLQRSSGTSPFTYTLRARNLSFTAGSAARDVRDIVGVRSTDGGLTWSSERLFNDEAAGLDDMRPFVSVDGKGRVAVFWHDHRDAGFGSNACLTSVYGTLSRDGGATWSPNFETTDELSFFSFNTLAVPNLGDYNQSAGYGDVTRPAWSDQRLSTGDVRNPGANTFSAGLGPEVYTTGMRWSATLSCPGDQVVTVGQAVSLSYTITNTGNIAESYNWTITDPAGWVGGNASGSTAVLAPGASESVTRNGTVGAGVCSDAVGFKAAAPGDVVGAQRCNTTLSIAPYTITASAGPGGSIAPNGAVSVACGASQSFGITPDAGFYIVDVLVDGASVGAPAAYTFTNVQANHTIAASFALIPAVIAAQSTSEYICPANTCVRLPVTISRENMIPVLGFSVTIQLSGNLALCAGTASITEGTFLSSAGATVFQVIDNGGGSYTVDAAVLGNDCGPKEKTGTLFGVGVKSAAAGGTGSITVTSVAMRDCNNRPIPANPGTPGTVPIDNEAPSVTVTQPNGGESWLIGSSQSITWTATDNTGVASVDLAYSTDDGVSFPHLIATGVANTGTFAWTVPNTPTSHARVQVVTHDVACSRAADASDASFTIRDPVITASAGAGGSVSPSGAVSVPFGTDQTFAITAAACHHIVDVVVDGGSVGAVGTYTFTNVTVDHTLAASFALNTYTITASAGAGGSISPSGSVSVDCGSDQAFTITPDACFAIHDVVVDGGSVGAVGTYTFTNVQASHTIAASFASTTQATTTTLTVSPSPSVCGQPATLTATVSPATATGSVEFFDGATSLGSVPLAGGVAALTLSTLAAGTHALTAQYHPTGCYTGSSGTVSHDVTQTATSVTLSSSSNPARFGTIVQLTAHVSPAGATGTVTFYDDVTPIGSSSVDGSGNATLSITTLAVGTHPLTAHYGGAACYTASVSPVVSQVITPDNPPSAHVIEPNGGEVAPVGTSLEIRWTATDDSHVASVTIRLSRDNGATWELIAEDIPNSGSYMWTVTPPWANTSATPVFSALIRVEAKDDANQIGSDDSDAPFAIFGNWLLSVGGVPHEFSLSAVWPNPSAGPLNLVMSLPQATSVRVSVVDLQGREVAVLASGALPVGRYVLKWDGRTERGAAAAGLYFVRYRSPEVKLERRFILAR